LQRSLFSFVPQAELEMKRLFIQLASAPLVQIICAIAIAPALGEELIFRGLIGTGLVARWGVIPGVLVTSILFGIMHINPAQAAGVIPLGIAMHFVYLTTRSFWSPVLLHLLNNSLAAVMLKHGDAYSIGKLWDDGQAAPVPLLTVSAAMVTAIGLLLWQTRIRFARQDGTVPINPWGAEELSLSGTLAEQVSQPPRPLLLACGIINSLGFLAVVWQLTAAV
jgi:hypothetical protein